MENTTTTIQNTKKKKKNSLAGRKHVKLPYGNSDKLETGA